MAIPKGYKAAKRAVITAPRAGRFQHEGRDDINVKNLLATGIVSAEDVEELIQRSDGTKHQCSPHHQAPEVEVHLIKLEGWYIKFYFIDTPDTMFISVHK